MPQRFALLKCLASLSRGNLLAQAGDTSSGLLLAGAPEVCHVFAQLRDWGWIEPAGREDGIVWWRITRSGYIAYDEGMRWRRSLSLPQRLFGPFGWVDLPPPAESPVESPG